MPAVGHVRLPTDLLYAPAVSARARDLWAILDDICRQQRSVDLPTAALAAAMDLTPRHLRRLVAELVDAGWLHVTTGNGRASVSRFTPLGRARPDLVGSVDDAVDPGRERRTSMSPFSRSKADIYVRLSGADTSTPRGRQEAEGQTSLELSTPDAGAPRLAPWCGQCDSDGYRWVPADDDTWIRCPRCNPTTAAARPGLSVSPPHPPHLSYPHGVRAG